MNNVLEQSYSTETGQVLNIETIKNYLVNGNQKVTDQEALMFLELCKTQKLNPFIREAYLIKFGSAPATIVVGKEVFVKRAYRNPDYEGMKAGIIVQKQDGDIEYREGSVKTSKEILIGGWCEVFIKNMKFPIRSEVSLEEYSKTQSTWKTMPCVMIRKCAIVTALREAFPEELQGLYDGTEMGVERLPQKTVEVGKASLEQKQMILKFASLRGLYSYENKKDTSKLEEFCKSNGFNLHELEFEEVEELIEIIESYQPSKEIIEVDNEVDKKEISDKDFEIIEG